MGADYKKKQSSVIGGATAFVLAQALTRYVFPFGPYAHIPELDARMVVPFDCLITDLSVRSSQPPGVGETYDYTVYLNGAPTALTLQIAGNIQVNAGPDLDVIAVADGDELSVELITSALAAAVYHQWSFEVNT